SRWSVVCACCWSRKCFGDIPGFAAQSKPVERRGRRAMGLKRGARASGSSAHAMLAWPPASRARKGDSLTAFSRVVLPAPSREFASAGQPGTWGGGEEEGAVKRQLCSRSRSSHDEESRRRPRHRGGGTVLDRVFRSQSGLSEFLRQRPPRHTGIRPWKTRDRGLSAVGQS